MKFPVAHTVIAVFAAVVCATSVARAEANNWHWTVASSTGKQGMDVRSSVTISQNDVELTSTGIYQHQTFPISSCTAKLADVSHATTLTHNGSSYLAVRFKTDRSAACADGRHPIAVVPVLNDASAEQAVATIARACCGPRVPSPSPQMPAATAPARSVAVAVAPRLTHWVITDGLFSFVRVRNRLHELVTIENGRMAECRDVAAGCAAFAASGLTIAPGATATVAAVMSGNERATPSFKYRYDVRSASQSIAVEGASDVAVAGWKPKMSEQEIRSAEAALVSNVRAPENTATITGTAARATPVPAYVAVRLTNRGSSRLAIGQSGAARVRVNVDATGMPRNVSIVTVSNGRLVAAALETAISSSYAPALRNGKPVSSSYIADFQFSGEDPALSSIPVWRRDSANPNATASPAP